MAAADREVETGAPARKRIRAATTLRAASTERTAETISLQDVMREIRELRAEREQFQQRETALLEQLHQRDRSGQSNPNHSNVNIENPSTALGYKLKPDTFDGSVPLREFLVQFNLIARANKWDDAAKVVALVACLRGKARAILDGVPDFENLRLTDLENRLKLRFGDEHMGQAFYTQFTNRRQKFGEDLPTLGADLERLARLAYPECALEVRDKIACAQFIAALTDGFVKRTLQLEGVTSLQTAIERAMAIRVIQENSFPRKQEGCHRDGDFNKENWKFKTEEEEKKRRINFKGNRILKIKMNAGKRSAGSAVPRGTSVSNALPLTREMRISRAKRGGFDEKDRSPREHRSLLFR